MNLKAVWELLGVVLLLMAIFLLAPALVGLAYGEFDAARDFLLSAVLVALPGVAMKYGYYRARFTEDGSLDFHRREGLAVVGLSWLVGGAAGAIPFMVHGTLPSFVDAYFESVSGLTTTGSTVMQATEIDGMSHAMAFWRSFTHWLGGFGIVMVFVVLFPTGGRSLFRSEIPGVAREAGHRRVRESAMTLLKIYAGITVIELLLLLGTGIGFFESVIHAFGTIPTGGFSNHGASVGYFDNLGVEVILTSFMFLCGLNFGLYETLIKAGPRPFLRRLWGSSEARWYMGIALFSTIGIAVVLWFTGQAPETGGPDYRDFGRCLRDSSFQVVCLQTSTGFATADFDNWPQITRVLLMFLAMMGACAGSTGGGIKMVRCMIVAKAAIVGVRRFIRPRAIHTVRMDGQVLDGGIVGSVTGYFALWTLVFLGGTLLMSCFGYDLVSSGTAVLATLNNIGPGLAAFGPAENFAAMPDLLKVMLTVFMILGRLEFYAVVALVVPDFWRK
tara:strand:- start:592 stop:2094 length:1503 start_codon:yes stop_codon:yes gene_type:complete